MDEDKFNSSLRSLLKKVGITSQREIEKAVWERNEDGRLEGVKSVPASVVVRVPELDVEVTIEEDIKFE